MKLEAKDIAGKNRLIAKFHGSMVIRPYHSSWDSLMSVVEKIESGQRFGFCIDVLGVTVTDYKENEKEIISISRYPDNEDTKISMTYEAVIEFIEWQNIFTELEIK